MARFPGHAGETSPSAGRGREKVPHSAPGESAEGFPSTQVVLPGQERGRARRVAIMIRFCTNTLESGHSTYPGVEAAARAFAMLNKEYATPVSGDIDVIVCISFRVHAGIGSVGGDGRGSAEPCPWGKGVAEPVTDQPVRQHLVPERPAAAARPPPAGLSDTMPDRAGPAGGRHDVAAKT